MSNSISSTFLIHVYLKIKELHYKEGILKIRLRKRKYIFEFITSTSLNFLVLGKVKGPSNKEAERWITKMYLIRKYNMNINNSYKSHNVTVVFVIIMLKFVKFISGYTFL